MAEREDAQLEDAQLEDAQLEDAQLTDAQLEDALKFLREQFPGLAHWPPAMLMGTPLGELSVANREQLNAGGRQESASSMAGNQQRTQISQEVAGSQSQREELQPSRFLPDAPCSLQQLWLQARKVLPESGVAKR